MLHYNIHESPQSQQMGLSLPNNFNNFGIPPQGSMLFPPGGPNIYNNNQPPINQQQNISSNNQYQPHLIPGLSQYPIEQNQFLGPNMVPTRLNEYGQLELVHYPEGGNLS